MKKKCFKCKNIKEDNNQTYCDKCNSKRMKKYYLKNREHRLQKSKEYNIKNKEKRRKYQKKYFMKNKEKFRLYSKKYHNKFKNNKNYKVKKNLRWYLWSLLKERNLKKNKSVLSLIGCSLNFLLNYLESKFKQGMSWNNYGEWHIDHIRPCSSFDLSKEEEQLKCFHYSNLQPLWQLDNLKKSDKYI